MSPPLPYWLAGAALPADWLFMVAPTIDVHDGHAHDAGDDNQGEAGGVVIHQQEPVDARLQEGPIGTAALVVPAPSAGQRHSNTQPG